MTPEQSAAEILIQGIARVESAKLVLLTVIACAAFGVVMWLLARYIDRRGEIVFLKARDAEARELVENSVECINRQASELRRYRNQLLEVDLYFNSHKPTFDDRDREPLVGSIKALLGERQMPPQITFQRKQREAA
jgi:hypothetical protein